MSRLAGGTRGAALAVALACVLLPLVAPAAERIRDFDVAIELDPDGHFRVEERIRYDFGGAERRGIFREIPVRYGRGRAADYRIGLDVQSVTDGEGRARPYRVRSEGANLRIRIGDPDRRVTGEHEYRITYRVRRGILWFEEHDELYWNVTGTEWAVPIDRASLTLRTPELGGRDPLRTLCFTGSRGSVETACRATASGIRADFEAQRPLRAREGLTAVVALPKGVLQEPGPLRRFLDRASDYLGWATLLPLLTLAGLGTLWRRIGRDPAGPVAIPVRYEPPEDMTPGVMGTVLDERADLRDITGTVLDLAVRGYLKIEETQATRFLFLSETDYTFHRRRRPDEALRPYEREVMNALFPRGDETELSDLRNKFYKRLPVIREKLYQEVSRAGGWFPTSPDAVRQRYSGIAMAIAIPGAIAGLVAERLDFVVAFALCGAIGLFFARHMPRTTRSGRRAKQHIRGFQEFLERVEVDRLERLGFRNSDQFERVLPFAFVVGAADAWAEAFADLYTEPPEWYVSRTRGPFRPGHFIGRVGHSLDTMGSVMRSQPRSRGSGSSGFGGGGFSGGGFGGGGGGSW